MFEQYENLNEDYVPNNICSECIIDREEYSDIPYTLVRNARGDIVGYNVDYGQSVEIPFCSRDVAYVEKDAIITYVEGQQPTTATIGNKGQLYYNIKDEKIWKCITQGRNVYEWEEQDEFTIPVKGEQLVYLNESIYPNVVNVYDFKGEIVKTYTLTNDETSVVIDTEEFIPQLYKIVFIANSEAVD